MQNKIREVLKKQIPKEKDTINVISEIITKPDIIMPKNPSISIDDTNYFYTFDGRSLMFSEKQKTPILSMPDETIMAYLDTPKTGACFCITLSSKGKLEYCTYDTETGLGERKTLNRNVKEIVKANSKLYYSFKKDSHWFINEAVYENEKWIGKHVYTFLKGDDLKLFGDGDSLCFLLDRMLYDLGLEMGIKGDYAHKYDKYVVIVCASEHVDDSESRGEMKLFSWNMKHLQSIEVEVGKNSIVKFKGEFIGILNEKVMSIYQICDGVIKILYVKKNNENILNFSMLLKDSNLVVYQLVEKRESNLRLSDYDSTMEDFNDIKNSIESINLSSSLESSNSTENKTLNNSLDSIVLKSENEANCVDNKPEDGESKEIVKTKDVMGEKSKIDDKSAADKSAADKSAADKSAADKNTTDKSTIDEQKSVLFETIEKMLAKGNEEGVGSLDANNEDKMQSKGKKSVSAEKEDSKNKITSIKSKVGSGKSETDQTASELCKTFEKMLRSNSELIKEIVVKALIPPMEAAINEMRVQIISEFKRMELANRVDLTQDGIIRIKKLLNLGRVGEAMTELNKSKESEFEGMIGLFSNVDMQGVESNELCNFIVRVYGQLKKRYKSAYTQLIFEALVAIEISKLSVDNLQSLSVTLRYLKDVSGIEGKENFELISLINITLRRIKKQIF